MSYLTLETVDGPADLQSPIIDGCVKQHPDGSVDPFGTF